MSARYSYSTNGNYKPESVLDSTVLVEDSGVVWNQGELEVTLSYPNNLHNTLVESNNESYMTANETNNETQYLSILETTNENILNDMIICNNQNEVSELTGQPFLENVCSIGDPDVYRVEGSDDLYAFEVAYDQDGNLQRFRYRLRANENGEYESIPDSIEFLPLDVEQPNENATSNEPSQSEFNETDENSEINLSAMINIKQECIEEQKVNLPDLSHLVTSNVTENINNTLQVNNDELEDPGKTANNTTNSVLKKNMLTINKVEFGEPDHLNVSNTNSFNDALYIHVNQTGDNINNSQIQCETFNSKFLKQTDNLSISKEDIAISNVDCPVLNHFIIHDNCANNSNQIVEKSTLNEKSKTDNIRYSTETHYSEESEESPDNESNIEYLEDLNDNESDADEFQIVDGIHVTADTESQEECPQMLDTIIHTDQPIHQILKLQQQFPVLEHSMSDLKIKDMNNKNINKINKNLLYYVIKHPEKENVGTIASNITTNKIIKTNPRSLLKSSYSYLEKTQEKQKPFFQKIEKKVPKHKDINHARVFHNFIAKTTIIHAPVRQQRLPRKQTIKPVERADEEIVVQEVVLSANGLIESAEYNKLKSKLPLKLSGIVQLSDSDDDYDPKKECKRKKKHKRRKSKVPEIIISDSENESLDENVIHIDLSSDCDDESDKSEDDNNEKFEKKSNINAEGNQNVSMKENTAFKKKRGRPPKRRNSSNEGCITDGSSSSKKQKISSDDSSESNESNESKFEEPTNTPNLEIHHIKKKWDCSKCPKVFPSLGSLNSHMQYHNFHEPNITQNEEQKIPENQFKKKYECPICKDTFKNNVLLTKHTKEHETLKKFECNICKKIFTDRSQLINHKRSHIKEQMFKNTTLLKHSPKGISFKTTNGLKCNICSKIFSTELLLLTHTKTHKLFTCTSCTASFISKLALEDHIRHKCVKQSKCLKQPTLSKTKKSLVVNPQRVSKRISFRNNFGKNSKNNLNDRPLSSDTNKSRNKIILNCDKISLDCDSCSRTFNTHTSLCNHKVVEHGLKTPDKNIHKYNTNKTSAHKESGKHSSVPAGEKLRIAFSTMKSVINK